MPSFVVFTVGLVTAAVLTGVTRRYALSRAMLDVPNARSAHTVPVPRGGGLAIAAVVLVGISVLAVAGVMPSAPAIALVGGGSVVAAVGWIDDRQRVAAVHRVAVHIVAAAWAVGWLGGLPAVRIGTATLELGWIGIPAAVLAIVWSTNLYNFMDGIDGLAGGQAVVAGAAAVAMLQAPGGGQLASAAAIVAGASAGFLLWNWAPARIFMGDVGSGTLGFVFGALAVASENGGTAPLVAWILLFGVFIFDATATLSRRLFRGERWYEAHRTHAYQRAVQSGWSHARVSGTALVIAAVLSVLAWASSRNAQALGPALMAALCLVGLVYAAVERRRPM